MPTTSNRTNQSLRADEPGIPATQIRTQQVAARVRARANNVLREVIDHLKAVPWYAALSAEDRSTLGWVAGRAIIGFADWLESDDRDRVERFVFVDVPPRMAAIIQLEQTVELVRLMTTIGEEEAAELGGPEHEDWVRRELMRFARDLGLALAGIYARAAEWRGSVDARIEAHLFNVLLSGGAEDEVLAAGAALHWNHAEGAMAVVGTLRPLGDDVPALVSRLLRAQQVTSLAGLHGGRLLVLLPDAEAAHRAAEVVAAMCEGPVVLGPQVPTLVAAAGSLKEALAGADACRMLADCPPVVEAGDLLPERALLGDLAAHAALVDGIFHPLHRAGDHVIETVSAYLDSGFSQQRTARRLHVHVNTVRYRLRRAVDDCGYDPTVPREGFTVQVALALGRRVHC